MKHMLEAVGLSVFKKMYSFEDAYCRNRKANLTCWSRGGVSRNKC